MEAKTIARLLGLVLVLASLAYRLIAPAGVPRGLRRVPGPRGYPILGNLLQLDKHPQRTLQRWAKQYGPVFQIRLGWENHIYVNDPAAVREIFDRQSAVTSGRQPFPVISNIMSGGKRVLFMTHNKEWRTLRAVVHQLLTPKASATFLPSQEFEAKQLLFDILHDQEAGILDSAYRHARRYTISVIMTSTYGTRVPRLDSEDARAVYAVMNDFSTNARPGAYIADAVPPLAKLPIPLQWWRKSAEAAFARQAAVWHRLYANLQAQVQAGKAPECFVKRFIESQNAKDEIDEVQREFIAGSLIEAGSETTSSSLNSAILHLAANPEVQLRARAELDRVIGSERLPCFLDESNLPYIRAIVTETLRIRPVTSIGTPHYTTKDLVYNDFFIPANTVVAINQYALHFDERYKDASRFRPERYLQNLEKAGVSAAQPDPFLRNHFSFGAGRRICPGLHLAENSLFITVAMILWAFEIRPPLDPDGREQDVDVSDAAYELGVNTLPLPYSMRFVPLTEAKAELVKSEWQRAARDGYMLGTSHVNSSGVTV